MEQTVKAKVTFFATIKVKPWALSAEDLATDMIEEKIALLNDENFKTQISKVIEIEYVK